MSNPFITNGSSSIGSKLFDKILSRTGAIGAKLRGYKYDVYRDELLHMKVAHTPKRFSIIYNGDQLVFDAATDITPTFTSKVTQFAVEDKSTITDHVILQNPTFSVSAMVSDWATGMNSLRFPEDQESFYKKLKEIRDTRALVSIVTPLDTYTSLIMTSVSFPRRTDGGTALTIEMSFEQIRVVSNTTTTVFNSTKGTSTGTVKPKEDITKKVQPETKLPAQQPKEDAKGLLQNLYSQSNKLSDVIKSAGGL